MQNGFGDWEIFPHIRILYPKLPLNSLTNGNKIENIIGNGDRLPIKITVTWTFKRNQQYYVI